LTDQSRDIPVAGPPARTRGTGRLLTLLAALMVLCLALAAVLWPSRRKTSLEGMVLVFDSSGEEMRVESLYRPLVEFLEPAVGDKLGLVVVRTRDEFLDRAARGVDFIFCPDGLALQLDVDRYESLVVGRRAAPRNLRPRSVLVYRKSAGYSEQPWLTNPDRTVIGDSLSLAATGAVLTPEKSSLPACCWGPDPYDHGPVLHAARLGSFDYACVRQWDAERFFSSGLLSNARWGMETLTVPVPDIVLFVSRRLPAGLRLSTGEALAGLGRSDESATAREETLARGLSLLHLVGFNILLEPDFDRIRGIFKGHWPAAGD